MKITLHSSFLVAAFLASQILASSKIEFDTKTFDCGIVLEGKTDAIKAVYNIKNTGDSVLKFESVRPGCGCTVVKYDTTIQPGKSGKIEASVNIKGYHTGPITKGVTVTSNAKNDPTVHLTIKATVQAMIDISENYLNFEGTSASHPKILYLSTKKADLKITGIEFKATDKSPATPDWQASIPLAIQYKPIAKDSTRSDGYKVFGFELTAPTLEKSQNGQITIKTNHPDKSEIVIGAVVGK
jgi:hypothetical protein